MSNGIDNGYGIARIMKYKMGTLPFIEGHNERRRIIDELAEKLTKELGETPPLDFVLEFAKENKLISDSNEDIDYDKTALNVSLLDVPSGPTLKTLTTRAITVRDRVDAERAAAGLKRMRHSPKNNAAFEVLLTAPDLMAKLSREEIIDFYREGVKILAMRFGGANILSAEIHMDEATPHTHVVIVPVTAQNSISACALFDGRQACKAFQDYMHKEFFAKYGLLRGLDAKKTKRRHYDTPEYKELQRLLDSERAKVAALQAEADTARQDAARRKADAERQAARAEAARQEAATSKTQAEASKREADAARLEAEGLRKEADAARQDAERRKDEAEAYRVAAEDAKAENERLARKYAEITVKYVTDLKKVLRKRKATKAALKREQETLNTIKKDQEKKLRELAQTLGDLELCKNFEDVSKKMDKVREVAATLRAAVEEKINDSLTRRQAAVYERILRQLDRHDDEIDAQIRGILPPPVPEDIPDGGDAPEDGPEDGEDAPDVPDNPTTIDPTR